MTAFLLCIAAIIAYIFGMMPWPVIVSRFIFHKDCRSKHGKINPSYGEFQQRYGIKGLLILIAFDVVFASLACVIGGALLSSRDLVTVGRIFGAYCYLLGCCFPFLSLYMGRRGIVQAGIMMFFIDWRVALICIAIFVIVAIFTKYVVVAGLAAAILSAMFIWIFGGTGLEGTLVLICAIVLCVRHFDSIKRLLSGSEHQLGGIIPKRRSRPEDEDEY